MGLPPDRAPTHKDRTPSLSGEVRSFLRRPGGNPGGMSRMIRSRVRDQSSMSITRNSLSNLISMPFDNSISQVYASRSTFLMYWFEKLLLAT